MPLVHKWKFEELTGTRMDSVGNLHLSPLGGDTTQAAVGIFGRALNAAETGFGSIQLTGTLPAFDAGNEVSLAFWVKFTANLNVTGQPDESVFEYANATTFAIRIHRTSSNILQGQFQSSGGTVFTINGLTTILENVWYHVVFTFQRNGFVRHYLNAVEDATAVATAVHALISMSSSPRVSISARQSNLSVMQGLVDELEIYNHQLTANEVRALWGLPATVLPAPNPYPNLTHLYEFERLSSGLAYDRVGFNHLTFRGTNLHAASGLIGKALWASTAAPGYDFLQGRGLAWAPSGADVFSVSLWYNSTTTSGTRTLLTVAFGANTNDNELQIIANATNFTVRVSTTNATHSVTTSGMPQRIDTWQHVACVFQRNVGFFVYQDGSLVGSLSAATLGDFPLRSWNTANHRLTLGVNHSANSSWAMSRLDQLAFFNTALTQAEVQTIYNYRAGVSLLLAPVTTEIIKSRLSLLLATVPNVGRVWTYEPEILEPSALETYFYYNGAVRAWTLACEAVDELELTNAEVERDHRMVLRGYVELNPGLLSQETLDALLDDIHQTIRDHHDLSGLVEYMTPASSGPVRLRLLAQSVPCHYVELTFRVRHVVQRANLFES